FSLDAEESYCAGEGSIGTWGEPGGAINRKYKWKLGSGAWSNYTNDPTYSVAELAPGNYSLQGLVEVTVEDACISRQTEYSQVVNFEIKERGDTVRWLNQPVETLCGYTSLPQFGIRSNNSSGSTVSHKWYTSNGQHIATLPAAEQGNSGIYE